MHKNLKLFVFLFVALTMLLSACGGGAKAPVEGARQNWTTPGGDSGKTRFSTLDTIRPDNVARLGHAWTYDLYTNRGQEATPIVVDGIMYTSGNLGRVYAINAVNGSEIWEFEPEVDMQVNRVACCDMVNRGVAVQNGKVFVAALDGHLYALNAKTGDVEWRTDTFVDRTRGYSITGAPEIAKDIVLIGNGGAEYDVRGYVSAYHIETGELAWRVFTVPKDPRLGAQESEALEHALSTWSPDSRWDIGGGGTVWDAIHYDAKFDTVYIGTGNGGPYNIERRSPGGGDNLYVSSVLSLDRATGKLKWYYQETPEDSWDYTASQPMVLTDLEIDGQIRPVILHAPKNGYLFVIDRETGKPLKIHGLVRTSWADGYDLETGRPNIRRESSDYWNGPRLLFPASPGARNWFPPAYDPERQTYFASILDMGNLLFTLPETEDSKRRRPKSLNLNTSLIFTPTLPFVMGILPPEMQKAIKALDEYKTATETPFISELRAIDPLTGTVKWAAPSGGWQDRGGVMATKTGLVFQGRLDGKFMVRSSDTGELLKTIETGRSIMAAPMSYEVDGVQYVAVATGFGGGGWPFVPNYSAAYKYGNDNTIMVFKLGGEETPLPDEMPDLEPAAEPPAQAAGVTQATIAKGQAIFMKNCSICHSNQFRSPSPDLRRMSPEVHELFAEIVLDGLYLPNGMPKWDDVLSVEDAKAVHAHLINLQKQTREKELKLKAAGKPLDGPTLTILSSF